jgi:hypothetical protein
MAYALHYIAGYTGIDTGNTGRVSIYEDDYSGGTETLKLRHNSVKIQYNWKGWDEPIIGQTASFSIVNDESDFFDLLPLMISEERKYLVIIEELDKAPNKIYFKGFLDCKDVEQKYLQNQDIRLNASGYLAKLQYVYAPTVETLENDTFINIILNCIDQTGAHPTGFSIRVSSSLYAIGSSLSAGQTLFNKCGVYKETFWKDNIERDSALDIIKKILTSFDCYLYWYDDYYYIERYADIWDTSPNYVTYVSGTEYYPPDTGSTYNPTKTITDFVSLTKTETSQVLSIITGQKQVEVNIEQQLLFNFINNDYANADFDTPVLPNPPKGQWLLWGDSGGAGLHWPNSSFGGITLWQKGDPFFTIEKSVLRSGFETDAPAGYPDDCAVWRGNYIKFRATVTDETIMTIKFKLYVNPGVFLTDPIATGPEDYNVEVYWYLRNPPGSYYFMYDYLGSGEWERIFATEQGGVQRRDVNGAEFDTEHGIAEIDISIALHEPYNSAWGGDQDFIFCLGVPIIDRPYHAISDFALAYDWRGDVTIATNAQLTDNYLSGTTNTKFLNKKTLTQYFCDAQDLGIRNAILYGEEDTDGPEDLDTRSTYWDDAQGSSGEMLELAEMKIKDKFRLYNVSRQKITTSIRANEEFYRPLSLFDDSNQDNSTGGTGPPQFVLVGYTYEPQEDRMDIILSEYDNEETINLI